MTDRLLVRRDGRLIGTLTAAKGTLWLRYSDDAQQAFPAGTPVLSCSLPLTSGRLNATAWARGLLPEGQHLLALADQANVPASDTYGLLARFGRDIAGALEIVDELQASTTVPTFVEYGPGELDGEVAALDHTPLAIHDDSELSLAGIQDKLVVVRTDDGWARPVHGYPSTHIVKVDPANRPGLVDAEAVCLRLAAAVGLTNIDIERARFGSREALIVSRFDRLEQPGGAAKRLHQEDLLQALGVNPDGRQRRAKYQQPGTTGPPSWWHAADIIDSYADDAPGQLRTLIQIVTFTTVIANADCHAKNLAFLLEESRVSLAPLYDTVPTALWPELRSDAAMTVAGVAPMTQITFADLVAEARRWRMPERTAIETITESAEALMDAVGVTGHDRVAALVTDRATRLLGQRRDS